jgi:hypothetical protein
MSNPRAAEYASVLASVRAWPPDLQRRLAEELIWSLRPEVRSAGSRGVPASQVRGMAAGDGQPPDDETVKQWVHEHRVGRYG